MLVLTEVYNSFCVGVGEDPQTFPLSPETNSWESSIPHDSDFCQMTFADLLKDILSPFDRDERDIFIDAQTSSNKIVANTTSYSPSLAMSPQNTITLSTSSTNTLVIDAIQASSVLSSISGATTVQLETLAGIIEVTASEANKLDLSSPVYNKLIVNTQQFNLKSETSSSTSIDVAPTGTKIT